MPIVSADFIVLIFMILFTGTAGITALLSTIRFITIHSIIHPGILHTTAGVGDTAGIRLTIAGVGVILPITARGTAHTLHITDGVIPTAHGTADMVADMVAAGMPIQTITVTGKDGQRQRTLQEATTVAAEPLLRGCALRPQQPKVYATVQLQHAQLTTTAGQLQPRV